MQRGGRDESSGARIIGALEDRVSGHLAVISDNPEPIAGLPCILNDIERLAAKGFRRITGKAPKLAIRPVAIQCSPAENVTLPSACSTISLP
jgi:hypothetical protein